MTECGALLDGRKLLVAAGVIYLGQGPTCSLPRDHQGLHRDQEYQWNEEWTRR